MKRELYVVDDDNNQFLFTTASLKDICLWFVENYPEDIFCGEDSRKSGIITIRDACKALLNKIQ